MTGRYSDETLRELERKHHFDYEGRSINGNPPKKPFVQNLRPQDMKKPFTPNRNRNR